MPFTQVFRALYEYEPLEEEELAFQEHAILGMINDIDDGWMMGCQVHDLDCSGLIPKNYIEIVKLLI